MNAATFRLTALSSITRIFERAELRPSDTGAPRRDLGACARTPAATCSGGSPTSSRRLEWSCARRIGLFSTASTSARLGASRPG
ncbi:hypothetical protein BE15_38360 [Sorangium cellulosum]|uniref:Uncharacterized protein n=1 Tax=Sorangium cellulosum TaxID=56 RepID=A0A150QH65_SORCE|nr:hypothetical protein BE15_38360 [Sorangium cellulosum]